MLSLFSRTRLLFLCLALGFALGGWGVEIPKSSEKRIESRLAENLHLRPTDVMKVYLPKGCRVACLLCLVAACLPCRRDREKLATTEEISAPPRGHWLALALCVALGATTWPRMQHGAWSDEHESVADCIVGEVSIDDQGMPEKFRPLPWVNTVFGYMTPNNHTLYSIIARVAHTAHSEPKAREDLNFSLTLLRLPSLIFGVAAAYLLWWLASRWAGGGVGWLTLAVFALHPWWLRYSTEARGYSLLLFLVVCLLWATDAALRSPHSTKRWLLFGFLEFCCLYTWPLAVHLLFWLNVGLVYHLWKAKSLERPWAAWLRGNLLGASLCFPLMLGHVPQIKRYLAVMGNQVGAGKAPLDLISEVLSGRKFATEHIPPSGLYPDWDGNAAGYVWLVFLAVALVLGAAIWWRSQPSRRWLVIAALAAPLCMVGTALATASILHAWYLVMFLPGVAFFIAMGLWHICSTLARRLPLPSTALAAICTGLLLTTTWWPRKFLITYPGEPSREAAALIGAPGNPAFINDTTAPIIGVRTAHLIHVPTARRLDTPEKIFAAGEEADRTGRKFYYYENLYGLSASLGDEPGVTLTKSGKFRLVQAFYGTYRERPIGVHEWIGGK